MSIQRADRGENVYLVAYDIGEPKRWRKVFRAMKGYGTRLQLSVWQCRLDQTRRIELAMTMDALIDTDEDQIVIIDVGKAEQVELKVECLGSQQYESIERRATIL